MPRPRYTEEQRDVMESKILDAGAIVLNDKGYRGFSLRAVAGEMGLTSPALYRYFGNKDELIAKLRAQSYNKVSEIVERNLAKTCDPMTKIRTNLREFLEFVFQNPSLYHIMFDLDQTAMPNQEVEHVARVRMYHAFHAIASEFVEAGYANVDSTELVHMCWIGIHGLVTLEFAHQLDMGRSKEQLTESVLSMLTDANYLKGSIATS